MVSISISKQNGYMKREMWNSIKLHLVGLSMSSKKGRSFMERIIRISNKDYKMRASALTQFAYKDETGRSFLNDLQELTKLQGSAEDISNIDGVVEVILKVAFTMIKQADKNQVVNYEDFLDQIDNLFDDTNWIQEVLELACSPLSRQLQNTQKEIN